MSDALARETAEGDLPGRQEAEGGGRSSRSDARSRVQQQLAAYAWQVANETGVRSLMIAAIIGLITPAEFYAEAEVRFARKLGVY